MAKLCSGTDSVGWTEFDYGGKGEVERREFLERLKQT